MLWKAGLQVHCGVYRTVRVCESIETPKQRLGESEPQPFPIAQVKSSLAHNPYPKSRNVMRRTLPANVVSFLYILGAAL
ncbi:hypothetical protein E2C01_025935 [Portunus trituberculatus]|uniref:Uncharacterized protein n=1 Tax=Portunus trituberculatus TaxID=210409 RepID=A0A5B7EGV0_PORTR|nr:hypothetical protein [Portunus trituberculatus]